MKKFLSLFLLCTLAMLSYSQDLIEVNTKESVPIKEKPGTEYLQIVGMDSDGYYFLKKVRTTMWVLEFHYELVHYNENLNEVDSEIINLDFNNYNYELCFAALMNDGVEVFFAKLDNTNSSKEIYSKTFDKQTLKPNSDLEFITTVSWDSSLKTPENWYLYEQSSDLSKFMIYFFSNVNAEEGVVDQLVVMNSDADLLWTKEIKRKQSLNEYKIEDYKIHNSGEVYLAIKKYKKGKREKRGREINYDYFVCKYSHDMLNSMKTSVSFPSKYILSMKLALMNDSVVLCAGYYSNDNIKKAYGSYNCQINPHGEACRHNCVDFCENVYSSNEIPISYEKLPVCEKGIDDFYCNDIVLSEDGGFYIIGERKVEAVKSTPSTGSNAAAFGSRVNSYQIFKFLTIVIEKYNSNGEIVWRQKINKHQDIRDGGIDWGSYYPIPVGRDLYLLYNDNPQNATYRGRGKYKYFTSDKSAGVMKVRIDSEGDVTRKLVSKRSDNEVIPSLRKARVFKERKLVSFGVCGKYQGVKIYEY